jgi:hypothetical protein
MEVIKRYILRLTTLGILIFFAYYFYITYHKVERILTAYGIQLAVINSTDFNIVIDSHSLQNSAYYGVNIISKKESGHAISMKIDRVFSRITGAYNIPYFYLLENTSINMEGNINNLNTILLELKNAHVKYLADKYDEKSPPDGVVMNTVAIKSANGKIIVNNIEYFPRAKIANFRDISYSIDNKIISIGKVSVENSVVKSYADLHLVDRCDASLVDVTKYLSIIFGAKISRTFKINKLVKTVSNPAKHQPASNISRCFFEIK